MLAIGLVVDDAIVVVEAVERHIEEGLAPKEAALKAMEEISGPGDRHRAGSLRGVHAHGVHPRHHRPAVSAIRGDHRDLGDSLGVQRAVAQPRAGGAAAEAEDGKPRACWRRFFDWFNRMFGRATDGYVRVSGALLRKSAVALLLLAGFGVARISGSAASCPPASCRTRTRATSIVNIQLPNAASLQRTEEVVAKVEKILPKTPGVEYTTSVAGFQPAQPGAHQLQRASSSSA